MTTNTIDPRVTRFRLTQMLIGALLGAIMGYGLMTGVTHLGIRVKGISLTDFLALLMSIMFLGMGTFIFGLSLNPKTVGKNMERHPDAPPATGKEVTFYRLQASVLALAGLLLGVPLITGNLSSASRYAGWVYAAILPLFLLQSFLNFLIWRTADEFLRKIMGQTAILSFWMMNACLFLLGSAEKLRLIHALSLWDGLMGMMVIYVFASATVATRSICK